MPDDVLFKSPRTGKVQAVPQENWEELLNAGYTPTSHKIMYSSTGTRAMVPNAELKDYMQQGYQTTLPTSLEKGVTGKGGWGAEGIPGAIWGGIKGLVPPDSTGGHPLLSKEAWMGPSGHILSWAPNEESGIGKAFSEAQAGYARGGLPEAVTSTAGALSPVPVSASRAAQLASQGESGKIVEELGAPAVTTALGYGLSKAIGGATGKPYTEPVPNKGGGVTLTPAEAVEFLHSPVRASLKYAAKRLFGETPEASTPEPTPFPGATSSATPVGNAPLPPVPQGEPTPFPRVQKLSDIKAAAKAEAKAAEAARKGGMAPPPTFAGATSSAVPIGNAPLPEVPQGSPTPFPPVQPKVAKAAAAGAETVSPSGTSLLSRGRTLVEPGAEPDLNNPAHVKMINDYQTMSGPALRQLASAGDRFAAFVLRHMPRP
jgi:hypothetical protein